MLTFIDNRIGAKSGYRVAIAFKKIDQVIDGFLLFILTTAIPGCSTAGMEAI